MKNPPLIGIMNGRLSPPSDNRIQSFPRASWEKEFELAAEIGFDLIELVFDEINPKQHPLMSAEGLKKLQEQIRRTGVRVLSVCADYFMHHPLHKGSAAEREDAFSMLEKLVPQCGRLGVENIVFPCVDASTLSSRQEQEALAAYLGRIHPGLEKGGINLALETDLAPAPFKEFISGLELPRVTINYDSGNSSSLGFRADQEFAAYGRHVSSVHIKDRLLRGSTVPLGTGHTDFKTFFVQLRKAGYQGPFIIQAARGADEKRAAEQQLDFVRALIQEHLADRQTCGA